VSCLRGHERLPLDYCEKKPLPFPKGRRRETTERKRGHRGVSSGTKDRMGKREATMTEGPGGRVGAQRGEDFLPGLKKKERGKALRRGKQRRNLVGKEVQAGKYLGLP